MHPAQKLLSFLLIATVGGCARDPIPPQGDLVLEFEHGPRYPCRYEVRTDEITITRLSHDGPKIVLYHWLEHHEGRFVKKVFDSLPKGTLQNLSRGPRVDDADYFKFTIFNDSGENESATFGHMDAKELIPVFQAIDRFLPYDWQVRYERRFLPDSERFMPLPITSPHDKKE